MEKTMFLGAEEEAKKIFTEHTSAYMHGFCIDPEKMSEEEIIEVIYNECAYILTEDLLNGKYTLKQYVAIRNELGRIIFSLEN